jgi:hypothetical protein
MRMRNSRWSRFFGILLLAGCADVTFDLLPPPLKDLPDAGGGGDENASGAPSGTGGLGAHGGTGGASTAPDGGSLPPGWICDGNGFCGPPNCHPEEGCVPCVFDEDCRNTGKPFCGTSGHCVACRPDFECPKFSTCDYDCDKGERCDFYTSQCAPDCRSGSEKCPPELPRCDAKSQRFVCTECDPNGSNQLNSCPDELRCTGIGSCEKCADGFDCLDDYRPICSYVTWECRGCFYSDECNFGVPPDSPFRKVCDVTTGRCMPPDSPPPSPEP